MVIAAEEMQRTRSLYEKKMVEFNVRWHKVEYGQLEVKQNLVKFNNFVREKQSKVEGGLSRVQQEQDLQEQKEEELKVLEERRVKQQARQELEQVVQGRRVFSKYLGSVVEAVTCVQCSAVCVAASSGCVCRDQLRCHLAQTMVDREEEAQAVERLKEQKMGQILLIYLRATPKAKMSLILPKN